MLIQNIVDQNDVTCYEKEKRQAGSEKDELESGVGESSLRLVGTDCHLEKVNYGTTKIN